MDKHVLDKELKYTASRSSGPGGQHANKVATKVQLVFDIQNSKALSEEEKQILYKSLKSKLTNDNCILLISDESRSQYKNKIKVRDRLYQIIKNGLIVPKKRKATKPKPNSIIKRLDKKKKLAFKKALRRKPKID